MIVWLAKLDRKKLIWRIDAAWTCSVEELKKSRRSEKEIIRIQIKEVSHRYSWTVKWLIFILFKRQPLERPIARKTKAWKRAMGFRSLVTSTISMDLERASGASVRSENLAAIKRGIWRSQMRLNIELERWPFYFSFRRSAIFCVWRLHQFAFTYDIIRGFRASTDAISRGDDKECRIWDFSAKEGLWSILGGWARALTGRWSRRGTNMYINTKWIWSQFPDLEWAARETADIKRLLDIMGEGGRLGKWHWRTPPIAP